MKNPRYKFYKTGCGREARWITMGRQARGSESWRQLSEYAH